MATGLAGILVFLLFLPGYGAEPAVPPVGPGSRYPDLFVTPAGVAYLTWVEPAGGESFRLQLSRFREGTWSAPQTVVEGDRLFVNWADFPSVYVWDGDRVAVHWLEKSAAGSYEYDVRFKVSRDGGKTWSRSFTPHRDGTLSEHGFVSFFHYPDGNLGLVWLDGRNMAGESAGRDPGDMALYTTILDRDLNLRLEMPLDTRTCECCPTAAVTVGDGIAVAYRDRSDEEYRNINIITYRDGRWDDPRPVAEDHWMIPACPVNGPALAARGSVLAVAWFTAPDRQPQVKVAFAPDGAAFESPIRVDVGQPLGRVDLEWIDPHRVLVSWMEQTETGAALRLRSVGVDGRVGPVITVTDLDPGRRTGYPRLAKIQDHLLLVWTDPGPPYNVRTRWLALSELNL
jgi:hypothetical protein